MTTMHAATTDARTIVRIVEVVDTREYEEIAEGKWAPIAGSGDRRSCDRCGREHEVHALVELSDGTTSILGTGCAERRFADMAAKFRSADSHAKTLARLRAEVTGLERKAAKQARIVAEIDASPVPELTVIRCMEGDVEYAELRCGDEGFASCRFSVRWNGAPLGVDEERKRCAVNGWKRARIFERGGAAHWSDGPLTQARERLERVLRKSA
jgi:hypothetical protein